MNWPIVLVAAAWSLLLPYIGNGILVLTDNILVRGALIIAVLAALTLGPVEGGVVLFAVGLTFLERNRRKIAVATQPGQRLGNDGVNQTPGLLEKLLSKVGLGHHYDRETVSSGAFVPKEDMGSNSFEPAAAPGGAVADAKGVLPTQPLGAAAAMKAYAGLF